MHLQLIREYKRLPVSTASVAIARVAHAYSVISKYGPSLDRAIGVFGPLLMFLVGNCACLYCAWGQF